MSVQLNPYLNFRGEAKAAMELYQDIFGGELSLNTFAEFSSDEHPMDPSDADNVMHAQLSGPDGLALMGAGTVVMPLERQMWGDEFGMLLDRFGVSWMVDISSAS